MKRMLISIVCVSCLLLSACQLLPKEETYDKAPLISAYQKEQWEFAYVQRGDLISSQVITCTYMPVQTQTLAFTQVDARFDTMFVSAGEYVQKGQLLAQLDLSGVYEQIEICQREIKKLRLQIDAVDENRKLALERVEILLTNGSQQELEAEYKKLDEQFDLQKQPFLDELELANMQLADCESKLESRQLRAGMDGIVTYVRPLKEGDRIAAGDKLLVIEDSASSVFCADSRYWQHFQPGQEYTITIANEPYLAVVVSEEELGLPQDDKPDDLYGYTYFQLKDQAPYLEDGDRGSVTLVLDCRESVLMIPESAVIRLKRKNVVFYQDKNGLKAYKEVSVGMAANGMIEILSGLEEGECIIKG